jgi:hypothetical protein
MKRLWFGIFRIIFILLHYISINFESSFVETLCWVDMTSRLGRRGKKKQEELGTYAEKVYFSQRHKQWHRYEVKKPRLPKESEQAEKWLETKFQPRTLNTFVGKHNTEVLVLFSFMNDIIVL